MYFQGRLTQWTDFITAFDVLEMNAQSTGLAFSLENIVPFNLSLMEGLQTGTAQTLDMPKLDVLELRAQDTGTQLFQNITGTSGNDMLTGTSGDDVINGLAGDDIIQGNLGNDIIDGGDGADIAVFYDREGRFAIDRNEDGSLSVRYLTAPTVDGTVSLTNIETLRWLYGDDFIISPTINGTSSGETHTGTSGNETLYGLDGNDTLGGGGGNDILIGGGGADAMDGGDGYDVVSYITSTSGVDVNLVTGVGTGGDAQGDTYANFGGLTGSNFDDILTIDNGQRVNAGAGDDIVYATTTLNRFGQTTGGPGGGSTGGDGNDWLSFILATAPVYFNLELQQGGTSASGFYSSFENIEGSNFNDVLLGDANNNIFDGRDGVDTMSYVNFSYVNGVQNVNGVTIDLRISGAQDTGIAGFDTLRNIENLEGTDSADVLHGGSGANRLTGFAGNDTISGHNGDDIISGGDGGDTLSGGDGIDTLDYSSAGSGAVTINLSTNSASGGNAAGDVISEFENIIGTNISSVGDHLTGTNSANRIEGLGGNDLLYGLGGNDTLIGGSGNDLIDGGDGVDVAVYATGSLSEYTLTENMDGSYTLQHSGANGTDQLIDVEFLSIDGVTYDITQGFADNLTPGDDVFDGTPGDDTANGIGGNDTLNGFGGNDTLRGGTGNDIINGGTGNDILEGQANDDIISGGDGNDIINGGDGRDNIQGGDGDDIINGGSDRDIIEGGPGADTISGGAGVNTLSYAGSSAGVTLNLDTDFAQGGDAQGDIFDGREFSIAIGSEFNDSITATFWDSTLSGLGGDDVLAGYEGDNTLDGGSGTDTAFYGSSRTINSITHNSDDSFTVSYSSTTETWTDTLINMELIHFNGVTQNLSNFETWTILTAGDDTFTGTSGVDMISGLDGNDTLNGLAGDDMIVGGGGNDILDGGDGNDVIDGESGIDVAVFSGPRSDYTITGANGNFSVTRIATSEVDTLRNIEQIQFDGVRYTVNGPLNFTPGNDSVLLTGSFISYEGVTIETLDGDDNFESLGLLVYNNSNNFGAGSFDMGDGNDTLRFDFGSNFHSVLGFTASGGAGNDVFAGMNFGLGYATVYGDAGNDTFTYGIDSFTSPTYNNGNMDLHGGTGDDVYNLLSIAVAAIENAGEGLDTVNLQGEDWNGYVQRVPTGPHDENITFIPRYTLPDNIENLNMETGFAANGNVLNNIITGNDQDNTINGRGGDDIIILGGGNDTIDGGDGNDIAVLAGNLSDYQLYRDGNGVVKATLLTPPAAQEGTDTLYNTPPNTAFNMESSTDVDTLQNIETLRFDDGDVQVSMVADDYAGDTSTTGIIPALGNSVMGNFHNGTDEDWFAIDITAGQIVRFELSLPGVDYDDLALYDSSGTLLARQRTNGDTSSERFFDKDFLDYKFDATGTYYIAAIADGETGDYTLATTELFDDFDDDTSTTSILPLDGTQLTGREDYIGDRDYLSFTVEAQTQVTFTLDPPPSSFSLTTHQILIRDANGTILGGTNTDIDGTDPLEVTVIFEDAGEYFFEASINPFQPGENYTFSAVAVSLLAPDDFSADATTTGVVTVDGASVNGAHENVNDSDWFSLNVSAGDIIRLHVEDPHGGFFSQGLNLHDANGTIIASGEYISPGSNTQTILGHEFDIGGQYYVSVNYRHITFPNGATSNTVLTSYTLTATTATAADLTGTLILEGSEVSDNILGTDQNNTIFGAGGNDIINAGLGNDLIYGGTGADVLRGEGGIDTFLIQADDLVTASDPLMDGGILDGGTEVDTILMDFTGEGVFDFSKTQILNVEVIQFENLSGSPTPREAIFNADLIGPNGVAPVITISGNALSTTSVEQISVWTSTSETVNVSALLFENWDFNIDFVSIRGTQNSNTIIGSIANDTIFGRGGNDILDGGAGIDTARFSDQGSAYTITNNGDGNITVTHNNGGSDGTDTLTNIEFLQFSDQTVATGIGNYGESEGPDVIDGTDNNDIINGLGGDDVINGLGGNDTLNGNEGNDVLNGGDGNDTLNGGNGNDLLAGGLGNDIMDGGAGIDTISYVGAGFVVRIDLSLAGPQIANPWGTETISNVENIIGSFLNDTLIGNASNNYLAGGVGADTLRGGAGDDTLDGGSSARSNTLDGGTGSDFASYDSGTSRIFVDLSSGQAQYTPFISVDGSQPFDTLISIENVIGTDFNDVIFGNGGDNIIAGGAGNDYIRAGLGNDAIYGGTGNSDWISYVGSSSRVIVDLSQNAAQFTTGATVNLAQGHDFITEIENIEGTAFNDILTGDSGNNYIDGQAGNDFIRGGDGNDTLDGGAGTGDWVSYMDATSGVAVNIGLSTRQATGGSGNDMLSGFENLEGSNHNDTLTGNAGNNYIDGQGGNDVIDGAGGTDTVSYFSAGNAVSVNLATGVATGHGNDTLSNIENVDGSTFSDVLFGDAGNNVLLGYNGNDLIEGGAGDDYLDGGVGIDMVSYAFATSRVTVFLDQSGPQNTGGAGIDTLIGFEQVQGSAFNDILFGDTGNNYILGGAGNDYIDGGDGGSGDFLDGGAGTQDWVSYLSMTTAGVFVDLSNTGVQSTLGSGDDIIRNFENLEGSHFRDHLSGSDDNNYIDGHDGDDFILGSLGNDTLVGGAGIDRVSYQNASSGVTIDLTIAGFQNTGSSGFDSLSGIELLRGSKFDDTLTGEAGDNQIVAAGGNDWVVGGAGNDDLRGGTGIDMVSYASAASFVVVDLDRLVAQETFGGGIDTLSGFEHLQGSNFNDVLLGDAQDNYILGGDGNDYISGGAGSDVLDGGAGTSDWVSYLSATGFVVADLAITGAQNTYNSGQDILQNFENLEGSSFDDALFGDSGSNYVDGQAGNDLINGRDGNDYLIGGLGNDTFVFSGAFGHDQVLDYNTGINFLRFEVAGLTEFNQLTITQAGAHTLLSYNGTSVRLLFTQATDITADDMGFNPPPAAQEKVDVVDLVSETPNVVEASLNEADSFDFKDTSEITIIADVMDEESILDMTGTPFEVFQAQLEAFAQEMHEGETFTYVNESGILTLITPDDDGYWDMVG